MIIMGAFKMNNFEYIETKQYIVENNPNPMTDKLYLYIVHSLPLFLISDKNSYRYQNEQIKQLKTLKW